MPAQASATLDATSPARPGEDVASSSGEVEVAPETVLDVGDRAGDFVIEGVLGRGSFGTVYRASHAVIGRRAAVKVLRDHAAEAHKVEAFIEEARLVARLRHPNIVDVLGFGQLPDGRHFQVMDLIDGPTLADHLRERGRLALAEALPILRGVASALDAVHQSGVAHRDLKPANVVLERRGKDFSPKLIDFGVAELIAIESAAAEATDARGVTGTPRYMAPEQCRGQAVDARADAYAFGLLAYEVLTGELPFTGADALELMLKHTSETPPVPSVRCALLPEAIDPILLSLLEKRPERRPLELVPVVERLEAIAKPVAAPAPIAPAAQAAPTARTSRRGLLGVVALVVVVVAVLAMREVGKVPPPAVVEETALKPTAPVRERPAAPTAAPVEPAPPEATPSAARVERSAPAPGSSAPRAPGKAPARGAGPSPSPGLEDTDNPFVR